MSKHGSKKKTSEAVVKEQVVQRWENNTHNRYNEEASDRQWRAQAFQLAINASSASFTKLDGDSMFALAERIETWLLLKPDVITGGEETSIAEEAAEDWSDRLQYTINYMAERGLIQTGFNFPDGVFIPVTKEKTDE